MTIRLLTGRFIAVLCLLVGFTMPAFAELTATVDRNIITELELVTLTVRLRNQASNDSPDFSVLNEKFDIVSQGPPSRSSQFTFLNGRQTSQTTIEWQVILRPKTQGILTIPSIAIGSESTQPIQIEVREASADVQRQMNQYVFFETSVDSDDVYVQQQVVYSVKLYYVDAIEGSFPPPPALRDTVVETIENEKRFEAVVNNRRYYVLEKRYAIFPQKSGELEIPRESFIGTRGRGRLFGQAQRVNAISDKHVINVKPKPDTYTGDYWLPARSLVVTDQWSDPNPQFRVGEPVNRTITVTATGLAASLLPPLETLSLPNAKTYQDPPEIREQASENGLTASVTTTIGVVPTAPGILTLPEIRIPWWNTRTNQMEVAIIPEQVWTVAPGAQQPSAPPTPAPEVTQEISAPVTGTPVTTESRLWRIITSIFIVLWGITLALWLNARRRLRQLTAAASPDAETHLSSMSETSEPECYDALARAARAHDTRATRAALNAWRLAAHPEIQSMQALADGFGDPELQKQLKLIDAELYGQVQEGDWSGDALIAAIDRFRKTRETNQQTTALLQSLNPV